jgi:hypothetical protein
MLRSSSLRVFASICAVAVSVACSVYDDSLLDGSGSEAAKPLGSGAAGEGASGSSGSGSSGSSGSGSGSSGSSGSGSSGSSGASEAGATSGFSQPPCDGLRHQDLCWYLSDRGQSCEDTCSPHGGCSAEAAAVVGSPAQGGSLASCASLLEAFAVVEEPIDGFRQDGSGLGCHLYGGVPYWLKAPGFSETAHDVGANILCACER